MRIPLTTAVLFGSLCLLHSRILRADDPPPAPPAPPQAPEPPSAPEQPAPHFAYALEDEPAKKIQAIARTVYGADDVVFTPSATKDLAAAVKLGGQLLPVCMAKTHLSLSDDATRSGRPRGFNVTVREVRLSAGAGYLVALTGEILTMPGLPREPAARRVTVHPDGRITGLMQGE